MRTLLTVLAVASPFLLAGLGAVGWLYRHERERRVAIEQQVSNLKYKAYIEIVSIAFDLMKRQRKKGGLTPRDQEQLVDRMSDATKELILFGSDNVLRLYLRWNREMRDHGTANLYRFGQIVVAIRQDMGNPKTSIGVEDILRQLITDYDKVLATGNPVLLPPVD